MNLIKDIEFQTILLSYICRDKGFIKDCGYLLSPDDFKPISGNDKERYIVAKLAFEHYEKTREPIGGLLRPFVVDHADRHKMGEKQTIKLLDLVKQINDGRKDIISVDAVAEKVIQFKKSRLKKLAVEQAIKLMEKGELTDDAWYKIAREAVENFSAQRYETSDYLADYKARIKRREAEDRIVKRPMLMIDALDENVRMIRRGQFAIWLGYLKSGKSAALLWTALSYIFQGLNVLYFTLEDSMADTENRMDAALTGIAIVDLVEQENRFKKRFRRMRSLIHAKLRIIDGTENGMSVADIEAAWEDYRNRGFIADAIIIDYDDEIVPPRKYGKETAARRLEFADIYRELRRLGARRNVFVWCAAQTGRKTEGKKIISSNTIAEDISKVRKVHLALGVGCGDWGEDSKYIYVTAAKNTKQHVGWNIFVDFEKGQFYVRDKTLKQYKKEAKKAKKEKD